MPVYGPGWLSWLIDLCATRRVVPAGAGPGGEPGGDRLAGPLVQLHRRSHQRYSRVSMITIVITMTFRYPPAVFEPPWRGFRGYSEVHGTISARYCPSTAHFRYIFSYGWGLKALGGSWGPPREPRGYHRHLTTPLNPPLWQCFLYY